MLLHWYTYISINIEFVQEFRKVARGSGYEGRPLIEEFKKVVNGVIRQNLMELEQSPRNIEQLYEKTINLNKH